MAGSACAQEEHRSERRPNGRTSARGGALSEWSRRRRAFAHAAAQRCKSVQSVMDTSQSVRTARVRGPATTVQVVGRGGGRTRLLLLCTGPSRSVVSSLIGYFLQWALSIPVQKMLRCSLRLDCCQWAGRRPLVLSRRLKLAAAGPLSGLATSTRRQRAGSQGDEAPARVGARCCHCPPRTRAGALWAPKRPRHTRRGPGRPGRVRWPSFFLAPAPRARAAMLKQAPRPGRARFISRAGSRTIIIRPKRKVGEPADRAA